MKVNQVIDEKHRDYHHAYDSRNQLCQGATIEIITVPANGNDVDNVQDDENAEQDQMNRIETDGVSLPLELNDDLHCF